MVVPAAFGYNPAAAADNKFMSQPAQEASVIRRHALDEFQALYTSLIDAGVKVGYLCYQNDVSVYYCEEDFFN